MPVRLLDAQHFEPFKHFLFFQSIFLSDLLSLLRSLNLSSAHSLIRPPAHLFSQVSCRAGVSDNGEIVRHIFGSMALGLDFVDQVSKFTTTNRAPLFKFCSVFLTK